MRPTGTDGLDHLDAEILRAAPGLTRPNVLELSRRLRVARNTVSARLERMEASGVVSGFGPMVDLAALGYGVLAFTTLEIAQGQEAVVIDGLRSIPEVLEVHKVTGPGDLLCRVVARSNEHLHDVLERMLANPGIGRTSTVLALVSPVARLHPSSDAAADLAR